jgi:hypothetical protein
MSTITVKTGARLEVGSGSLVNTGPSGPVGCPARLNNYIADVISDSPIVYYRFNDASGPTAVDSSGNAKSGTYVGATHTFQQNPGPTTCVTDEYVSQNGSSSSVDLLDVALDVIGSVGQDFTYEMWVQIPSSGFGFALIEKTVGLDWNSIAIVNSISGRVRAQILGSGENPFVDGATAVNDGNWHHCVAVFDRATLGEIRLYVDGVSDATPVAIPNNGTVDSSNTNKAEFGTRDIGMGASSLVGDMAHGAVYLSALSATRILSHYNKAIGL